MKKLFLVLLILTSCSGPRGDMGSQGIPGQSCTTTPVQNGVTITCPGSLPVTVYNGVNGLPGATGGIGPTGAQGPAGSPGTVITPVVFCPGVTVYPTVFLEYGLCISGTLYAVYSANNGFLVELPDGEYQSNAIGSSCDFTVTGCEISY